ncbi:hypothetical protein B7463_g3326, partial [Scytalidium lignicola]
MASENPDRPKNSDDDELPEMLKDDLLMQYFRCRYEHRENFLKIACKGNQERIKYEEEKIKHEEKRTEVLRETLRQRYARASQDTTTEENNNNIELLHEYRMDWRSAARENSRAERNIIIIEQNRRKRLDERRQLEQQRQQGHLEEQEQAQEEQKEQKEQKELKRSLSKKLTQCPKDESNRLDEDRSRLSKKEDEKLTEELELLARVAHWEILPAQQGSQFSTQDTSRYGIHVYEIALKKSGDSQSYTFNEMKRHPVDRVLGKDKKRNPFMSNPGKDTIRYFHLPANNMRWVEEVIGQYYGEERGEYNYKKSKDYRQKSSDLLCREFWTAQQHNGPSDPVHARHMRPQCAFIQRDDTRHDPPIIGASRNHIIFMPYLHWETDGRRREMARISCQLKEEKEKEQRKKGKIHFNKQKYDQWRTILEDIRAKFSRSTMAGIMEESPNDKISKITSKGEPKNPLGKYLSQVAKVYNEMDIENDVKLLRENLFDQPPLHGRRTLDQSYYWKLENTEQRDRDQVVSRGTRGGSGNDKSTPVIMVDQLWLYILDDNTIISSFPRRWGRNKSDPAGVQKCIRSKLQHLREGQVQSVHDLAVIIMDQCSTVFFDRTRRVDNRPELLDLFATAIGNISEMRTIAYESFWHHLQMLNYTNLQQFGVERMARIYLNINPEGVLLGEAHDIMDELRMMIRVFVHQLYVAKKFHKSLRSLKEREAVVVNSSNDSSTVSSNKPDVKPPERQGSGINESTIQNVHDLIENIEGRRHELQDLEENTKQIIEHLNALLTLKQQQASIIEAKAARDYADQSVTQGRSIMLFTIVTIIFLPLSYISSIFGMNSAEFNSGSMSLHQEFVYMFSISVAIVIVALCIAFNPLIREFFVNKIPASWRKLFSLALKWKNLYGRNLKNNLGGINSRKSSGKSIFKLLRRERDKIKRVSTTSKGNLIFGEQVPNGPAQV